MARCDTKLKLSVRQPTTLAPRLSKACVSIISLQLVLTCVRCTLAAYQVKPISSLWTAGKMSW